MADDDLVEILYQELQAVQLRYEGITKKIDSVYLVYTDARIDENLGPIEDKYHKQFAISHQSGGNPERILRSLGFNPQSMGKEKWEELLMECEIVEFKLK